MYFFFLMMFCLSLCEHVYILCSNVTGCPDGKKVEFITSLLDALTTDMVNAINSPTPSGGGR